METVTLWCENGEHNWERPRQRGRKPTSCPEHTVQVEVGERMAKVQEKRITDWAEIDAIWHKLDESARRRLTYVRDRLNEVYGKPDPADERLMLSVKDEILRRSRY